jgi:hypothetical protein
MPRPNRDEIYSDEECCVVHCFNRCVRQEFLLGIDEKTGEDRSYRKQWLVDRLESLVTTFAIDVLDYAIMDNHFHVLLRNRPEIRDEFTPRELAIRWLSLYPGRRIDEFTSTGPTEAEIEVLINDEEQLGIVRKRIGSISWFMSALSEPIARRANIEDNVSGKFWENRFKAERMLDEASTLACSIYINLNHIRAKKSNLAEDNLEASIKQRLDGARGVEIPSQALNRIDLGEVDDVTNVRSLVSVKTTKERIQAARKSSTKRKILAGSWLAPLTLDEAGKVDLSVKQASNTGLRASDKGYLPLSLDAYVSLMTWTAANPPHRGKETKPAVEHAQVLEKLGIDPASWSSLIWGFEKLLKGASRLGNPKQMEEESKKHSRKWSRKQLKAATYFRGNAVTKPTAVNSVKDHSFNQEYTSSSQDETTTLKVLEAEGTYSSSFSRRRQQESMSP